MRGSFIPSTAAGLPLPLITESFNAWLKFVTENPAASRSIFGFELYHHDKWNSVPAHATAYANRNPVRFLWFIIHCNMHLDRCSARQSYNVIYLITWTDPSFTEHASKSSLALYSEFIRSRDTHFAHNPELLNQGGYANYHDDGDRMSTQESVRRRFRINSDRLLEVKQKYDPACVFGRWFMNLGGVSG